MLSVIDKSLYFYEPVYKFVDNFDNLRESKACRRKQFEERQFY